MKRLIIGLFVFVAMHTGSAGGEPLQQGDAAALGFDPASLSALDNRLQASIDSGAFPGAVVMVVRDGQVAHLRALGLRTPDGAPMTADSIFRIYSMTKPIVSVAALMLVERGKLRLDQPLSDLIPAYAATRVATGSLDANGDLATEPAARPITIRDLMRHTSGLTYGFFGQGLVRQAYRDAAKDSAGLANVAAAMQLASLPLEHQPGTTWEYSRATDVLGAVVEIVAGKPLGDTLAEMIFTPLGMHDTGFTIPDETDHPRIAEPFDGDRIGRYPLFNPREKRRLHSGGGGLLSTVQDYARFAQMLLNGGELNGVRVLKIETVAMMTRDHTISEGIRPGKYYIPGRGYGFGLGVAVRISDERASQPGTVGDYFWGGAAGTSYFADPAQNLFAILMIQSPKSRRAARAELRAGVYEAMARR
ncbi:MAG: serine hydrolase [Minwuia sp.]|nr:serine hydrolase [Minwuia sp.]